MDPHDGGRWTSLQVVGLELLGGVDIAGGHPPTLHGSFVMAPFAGRLRHGRLTWRGREYPLPLHAAPHAIHGTAVDTAWEVASATGTTAELWQRLAYPWPFAGTLRQELELHHDRLATRLTLHADEEMPAVLGHHPWFRRQLDVGSPVQLDVRPRRQYERGADGLPTGRLVSPQPGPHDDCFLGVDRPPRLVWPGALEVTLVSPVDHWVVFDERPEAVCVEPQTGPPDAVRLGSATDVPAGGVLTLPLVVSWTGGCGHRLP